MKHFLFHFLHNHKHMSYAEHEAEIKLDLVPIDFIQ